MEAAHPLLEQLGLTILAIAAQQRASGIISKCILGCLFYDLLYGSNTNLGQIVQRHTIRAVGLVDF